MAVKKLVAGVALATGLFVAAPGVAHAAPERPVYSQDDAKALYGQGEYEEEYCPIENRWTTFQLREDGTGYSHTECLAEPNNKRLSWAPRKPTWWNPFSWYNGVLW